MLLFMLAIGKSVVGWVVQNRFGKEFLGFTAVFVSVIRTKLCLDFFILSLDEGWMLFSI